MEQCNINICLLFDIRSEEDYFYEEEENVSLSPEVEPEYRSHRSRNHQPKRYRQKIHHDKYI